jgi:hypothetical protein
MIKLTIAEYQFLSTTAENQQRLKSIASEFAESTGIDWEFEYRWMMLTDENYLIAKLKYPLMIGALQAQRI